MKIRTYHELIRLETLEDRYQYLRIGGKVGDATFGFDRYLNQILYTTDRWKKTRRGVIIRDNACDLGLRDHEIHDRIIVHHINPITIEDIELERDWVYDPEFLISTSGKTHRAIHYGDKSLLPKIPIERKKNDTCPWRK